MKTITITEAFDGYPDGAHEASQPVSYRAGQIVEAPDDFADLVVGKGLAVEGQNGATAVPQPLASAAAVPAAPATPADPQPAIPAADHEKDHDA